MPFHATYIRGSAGRLRRGVFNATLLFILTLGVALSPAHAQSASPGDDAFEALVRKAYQQSPELQAAFARWQAALERVPQAESLPDPALSYGYFVQSMNTRQRFRVEQMFPGWGKRDTRASVAQAAAEAAAVALEATAADIRLQVLEAAANYTLALRATSLVEENLRLVESLADLADQRYRTGNSSQADVLRLMSEADSLRVELQSWQESAEPLRAGVNALLGQEATQPLPALDSLPELPELAEAPLDDLRSRLPQNPDLREAEAEIRRAQQARELADIDARPDVMLGVEMMDNRGMARDEVMGMVSVNVPLWRGRYRAARREAAAELEAAQASYADRFNKIESESRLAHYELRDALRQVRLFEDSLIPRARQTLSIVESDYRAGASSFLDLLEAQRSLLDLELGALRARTDAFVRSSRWDRLTAASTPTSAELGLDQGDR